MEATNRTRPLKVGIQLPEIERVVRWPEVVIMARRAEEVGFDSLWVGDHLLYRRPDEEAKGPWEAWSTMAALAAITERVEIGPLVACTSFHSPQMLAKKAATIDDISGGRLILGLGAGWNEAEYHAFGYPYDHRVSRFEEAFTIIRTLLQEGYVDFEGTYYQAPDCLLVPRGPRLGGPPLMVGSEGERMLRITLPHVDAWNAWYAWFGNRPEGLVPLLQRLDAACEEVGRDPTTLERTCAVLVGLTGAVGRVSGIVTEPASPPLTGTAEQLAETLVDYARIGVGHVQLVLDPNTLDAIDEFAPVLEILDRP